MGITLNHWYTLVYVYYLQRYFKHQNNLVSSLCKMNVNYKVTIEIISNYWEISESYPKENKEKPLKF